MSAEGSLVSSVRFGISELQRSRAHVSAEGSYGRTAVLTNVQASTEPRSRERGGARFFGVMSLTASRFNGAALT